MKVTVNGQVQELEGEQTVTTLLDRFGIHPDISAVEVNLAVVKRKDYDQTKLKANDRVEVVTMMGGG